MALNGWWRLFSTVRPPPNQQEIGYDWVYNDSISLLILEAAQLNPASIRQMP
jgi:hypothetical protein